VRCPRAWPAIAVTIPSGFAQPLEARPLLDVQLQKTSGTPSAGGCPSARSPPPRNATTARGASRSALGRLDRGDHAQRAVELPPSGTRVEGATRSTPGVAAQAEQVPAFVAGDLQPRLAHPLRRQLVAASSSGE
jgi:hypothetical protein